VTFIPETIEPICFDVIESVLKDKLYNDSLVQLWVDDICSKITKELIETNKPFKYLGRIKLLYCATCLHNVLVSCTVMQKNGAGLHLGHSCYWDIGNDNSVIARWPNEKRKDPNARMVCLVTIFGLAF